MSYGLQVDGANNQVIIDSQPNANTGGYSKFLAVSSEPAILTQSDGPLNWDYTKKFLFLRPGNNQTEVKGILYATSSNNSRFTIFEETGYTVKYFFAEITEDAPEINVQGTNTPQTYGLRVFEADGTTPIFSSTRMERALNIRGTVDAFATAGRFDTSNRAEIFSGDVTSNVYINTGQMLVSGNINMGTFIFAPSVGKIYFYSFFPGIQGSAPFTLPAGNYQNFSGIIIAELKS